MNEQIDLKVLEKRAWRSAFQDGIWDIYLGLLFLGLAIAPFGDTFGLPAELGSMIIVICFNSIAVLFLILGKKFITIPRIGFVKFGAKRKKTKKRLLAFLVFNILLAFVFLSVNISGIFEFLNIGGIIEPLIIGLFLITVPLSILAYFLEFHRLYIYAIFFGLGFFNSELLYPFVGSPLDLFLSLGLVGIAVISIGLVYLVQFLRKYRSSRK
ncbi:MAG: hypothetical protein HWN80_09220 [Candidatus Lokiarchaeota archaeon]|nr:hypothetical protein [Candidatus Lokiarchaeota archaeon]